MCLGDGVLIRSAGNSDEVALCLKFFIFPLLVCGFAAFEQPYTLVRFRMPLLGLFFYIS